MPVITVPGFHGGHFRRVGLAGGEVTDDRADENPPDIDKMTKAELLAEAERRGIDVKEADTKAEIIAALGV